MVVWMETADYPLKQAPLYHAVQAALQGADHLLQINAETRGPADRIYQGLARSLALFKAIQAQNTTAAQSPKKRRGA